MTRKPGSTGWVAAVCVLGVLLTALGAWAAARADQGSEDRLLEGQTRQAASVLAAAVANIEQRMYSALDVQASVGATRREEAFLARFARDVGEGELFIAASLWSVDGDQLVPVTSTGAEPVLSPNGAEARDVIRRAAVADTSVVRQVTVGGQSRIVYALGDSDTRLVVYAERAIPPNRRGSVDRDSAYADLNYAIYLGERTDLVDMTTTNVDHSSLPLTGTTSTVAVPFGDTVLTLVTSPRRHLGNDLNRWLPWLVLLGGLVLTVGAAAVARQVLRARDRAEADTQTITALYERVDTLYGEQRDLSVRLQRALLPRTLPHIPGIEVAADYAAAATGIDIGGDWYSVIGFGDEMFAFVVGDVSGHGVDAVAEMARARFTLRAYLLDGNSPEVALEKCSRQFDVVVDGHIVTVVAGVGNRRTGHVTMVNGGHPSPLLLQSDGSAEFVGIPVGPPLGAGAFAYESVSFVMPVNSTLVCYTDGLIERRGESIDVGRERLRTSALRTGRSSSDPLAACVSDILRDMSSGAGGDDIAVLALRRLAP